ncbi:hypothetical protein VTN02DRAFT_6024 [Thermoascus thermophilus]
MSSNGQTGCRSRLLALPYELRDMIYKAVLAEDDFCEIKRKPIRIWCEVESQWLEIGRLLRNPTVRGHYQHVNCQNQILQIARSDLYLSWAPLTISKHFPCPGSLDRCMDLNLLLTCRQVYHEARILPYTQNWFRTWQLGSFSNFTWCLKSWQVRSIAHLAISITEDFGMHKNLAEWNEMFSLIAESFLGLQTLSIEMYLDHYTDTSLRSTFWDGGLLELDRLNLKGIQLILHGPPEEEPYLKYAAGVQVGPPRFHHSSQDPSTKGDTRTVESSVDDGAVESSECPQQDRPVSFRHARNLLRARYGDVKDAEQDQRLFFRFSPNPNPLYVRNLIRMLPRRGRTHADIRREDMLQREYSFHNAYEDSDTEKEHPIIGFQFRETASPDEVARGLQKMRVSRERLVESCKRWGPVYQREAQQRLRERRLRHQTRPDAPSLGREVTRAPSVQSEADELEEENRGQWRRRLMEETFSPFIESFPIQGGFCPVSLPKTGLHTCIDCPRKNDDLLGGPTIASLIREAND